ncbi:MAG: hypothetical protein LC674_01590 [Actinobacteria bacterium]|nr:hypothetical protein [Actinomycetota bacterium]
MKNTPIGERRIAPNGDTLQPLNFSFLENSAGKDYEFVYYARNGVRFVRVDRQAGRTARGQALSLAQSRLRLPSMDSTDHIVLEGRCLIDGKDAPLVVAITGTAGDSVYRYARHAWRLDTAAGVLREIPIAGVTCRHDSGEE